MEEITFWRIASDRTRKSPTRASTTRNAPPSSPARTMLTHTLGNACSSAAIASARLEPSRTFSSKRCTMRLVRLSSISVVRISSDRSSGRLACNSLVNC